MSVCGYRFVQNPFRTNAPLCRAATRALQFGTTISPDYGYAAESPGYVDFLIDGDLNMGIELTRDGKALSIHEKRFGVGGAYAPLLLASWVVVDLRVMSAPQERTVQDHPSCLFVNFSSDFTRATIIQYGQQPEAVVFHSPG